MNELINVNFENQTVSARELYETITNKTERFSSWFDRQLQYGFVENEDYVGCEKFHALANQTLKDYEMSVDMAKHICMVQKNDKARQIRQYLIDMEKAWNTPEQVMARALKIADQTIHKLQIENKQLSEKIEKDKPKTIFSDAVSSATGDKGASSATGYRCSAIADHPNSIAVAWGYKGKAKGVKGARIVLADWVGNEDRFYEEDSWNLNGAKMVKIDGKKYKENTWYTMIN